MLYPSVPEKVDRLIQRIHESCDADDIPHPEIGPLDTSIEEQHEVASRFLEDVEPADPVDGYPCFRFRGKVYALVAVKWPAEIRDSKGQKVLWAGNAPCGPDPMALWTALRHFG
jgi:hypothetical protein